MPFDVTKKSSAPVDLIPLNEFKLKSAHGLLNHDQVICIQSVNMAHDAWSTVSRQIDTTIDGLSSVHNA